jgi:hypothetical protein
MGSGLDFDYHNSPAIKLKLQAGKAAQSPYFSMHHHLSDKIGSTGATMTFLH